MGYAEEMKINHSFHQKGELLLRETGAYPLGNSECLECNLSKFYCLPSFLAYKHHSFKENDLMMKSQIVAKPAHLVYMHTVIMCGK